MKSYAISVTPLDQPPPGAMADAAPRELRFTARNHDDIFAIADRLGASNLLPADEVAEFALGLKLFSEVVLRHRKEPFFAEIFEDMGAFMKRLKAETSP